MCVPQYVFGGGYLSCHIHNLFTWKHSRALPETLAYSENDLIILLMLRLVRTGMLGVIVLTYFPQTKVLLSAHIPIKTSPDHPAGV